MQLDQAMELTPHQVVVKLTEDAQAAFVQEMASIVRWKAVRDLHTATGFDIAEAEKRLAKLVAERARLEAEAEKLRCAAIDLRASRDKLPRESRAGNTHEYTERIRQLDNDRSNVDAQARTAHNRAIEAQMTLRKLQALREHLARVQPPKTATLRLVLQALEDEDAWWADCDARGAMIEGKAAHEMATG